jgi:hypothetical protein
MSARVCACHVCSLCSCHQKAPTKKPIVCFSQAGNKMEMDFILGDSCTSTSRLPLEEAQVRRSV